MIKIAGAGLSGMSAAINLGGYDEVLVYEKEKRVGNGYNTSILAFKNYDLGKDIIEELNDMNIRGLCVYPIHKIIKYSPSLESFELKSKRPLFYTVYRGICRNSLENTMYKSCLRKGVNLEFESDVGEDEVNIVATGAGKRKIFAYGITFENVNLDRNTILIFYDNSIASKGYICVLPFGNSATVGSMVYDRKLFEKAPILLTRALQENRILNDVFDGSDKICSFSGYCDYHYHLEDAFKNGRYYVGEAAGFLEPSKGFGMRYALLSGFLAAHAIKEGEDYENLCRSYLNKNLYEDMELRKHFQQMTNKDYEELVHEFKNTENVEGYMKKKRLLISKSKIQPIISA